MDFLKELLGRCVGKTAPVHKKNLEKASVSNFMDKIGVVDLGLPSGVLWATENLGISSVYPLGKYFAWGETECKTSYGWDSYTLCKGTYNTLTKYSLDSKYGIVDGLFGLASEDDIATLTLGKEWHIPSKKNMEELLSYCSWKVEVQEGIYGWRVTGPNGKSIYLAAAGSASGNRVAGIGEFGRYWTSTLYEEGSYSAYNLRFNQSTYELVGDTRFYGRIIRPVKIVD